MILIKNICKYISIVFFYDTWNSFIFWNLRNIKFHFKLIYMNEEHLKFKYASCLRFSTMALFYELCFKKHSEIMAMSQGNLYGCMPSIDLDIAYIICFIRLTLRDVRVLMFRNKLNNIMHWIWILNHRINSHIITKIINICLIKMKYKCYLNSYYCIFWGLY